ncbi:hypothetical protein [Francisella sp. 19X1-34]|uniref:hypothetical protein n=1 Tax=Francisella sp. 19X1-34 TaxID=3087177 RepID=UPI002E32E037|nr:hypothetical protein [Francisella sp. 19X1-34]MED7787553.1 hypothetical protein [Francisella sp. 19X1-34]
MTYKYSFEIQDIDENIESSIRNKNIKKGIFELPYPFTSVVAVCSDIDFSSQVDHEMYTSLLTRELGLDFSDSCFLFTSMPNQEYGIQLKKPLAFFNHDGCVEENPNIDDGISYRYLCEEYVKGRVDHFHGFSDLGFNYLGLENIITNREYKVAKNIKNQLFNDFDSSYGINIPIYDIYVSDSRIEKIEVLMKDHEKLLLEVKDKKALGKGVVFSNIKYIKLISEEEIRCGVILSNSSKENIIKMLISLKKNIDLQLPLITDHASTFFLNSSSELYYKNKSNSIDLSQHWVRDLVIKDIARVSTLIDDKKQKVYLASLLKKEFSLRFVNPSGLSGEDVDSFSIFNVLRPSLMRDGDGIYVARRILMLNAMERRINKSFTKNRRTLGFHRVIDEVLSRINSGIKDRVFPIYTHLGFIKPSQRNEDYYFKSLTGLKEISNSFYGKKSVVRNRVLFTKAISLYDYSLVINDLYNSTKRLFDNIFIFSWKDKTLKKKVCTSLNSLNGVSFRVKSFKKTRVYLNFKRIRSLAYFDNGIDGKVVKIIGRGYKETLLNKLTREKSLIVDGYFTKDIKFQIDAQYIYMKFKKNFQNSSFGIIFTTLSGGRFLIGNNIDISDLNVDAYYFFKYINPENEYNIPLYDFTWVRDTPSLLTHEISRVEIDFKKNSNKDELILLDLDFFKSKSF